MSSNSNVVSLNELLAEHVFKKEGLQEYEQGMKALYLQLVHLNMNIFIVEHVAAFPFHVFVAHDDAIFFRMVIRNFIDMSVLIITRIAVDQGDDLLTLPRFKNRVRNLVKSEHAQEFDRLLQRNRFTKRTRDLLHRARDLRTRIAHLTYEAVSGEDHQPGIALSELQELRDTLSSLLQAISFDTDQLFLPIPYEPRVQHPAGTDSRPDIEKLLDSIAKGSTIFNLPESDPTHWSIRRRHLPASTLSLLNSYRRKLGFPEA